MGLGDVSLACAGALVDALVRGGMRHACVSPGSRSTALALALARHPSVTTYVHLDERSAAFFAVGLAKASDEPVAIACTSGTATAEFLPAVVEASQSRTPLVVLTADRPPGLRGTGANQTIDQTELYGAYARAYLEPPVPEAADDAAAWRDTGIRAITAALAEPRGPVHVNCPFDEPLVPESASIDVPAPNGGRVVAREPDREAARAALEGFLTAYAGRRGVVALGSLRAPRTLALLSFAKLLGWPVLAEPLSGLRLDASDAGRALAAGQWLIGDAAWLARRRPEVVLQVGAAPTTRATQSLVAAADASVVLDREHLDPDPAHRAERRILVDPELFAAVAWDAAEAEGPPQPCDPEWSEAWRNADLVTRAEVDRRLDAWDEPFEGRVARDLAGFVPNGAVLCVGSSTPVRDLDAYMALRRPPTIWSERDLVRFVASRGASGIDGFVSTALGAAAADVGPTYALMGDLTLLHDAGALLWSARRGHSAVLVVLNNGGGEIFSLLPQRALPEHRELFLTPHGVDIGAVCGAAGAGHERIDHAAAFLPAVERAARTGEVRVVEVAINPELGRLRRDELRNGVAAALAAR
jgi:2-succinyl-5-enolpyruvyl-6-hydroxy-3-cyclohexene-1-carboxylate synthase